MYNIMLKIIGFVALFLGIWFGLWVLGAAIGIFSMPFHAASNAVQTGHDVIDKTINADNAIYNYEWFKQQKQDIDVAKQQYQNAVQAEDAFKAAAGPRTEWTWEDKQEAARLSSITLGLKQQVIQRTEDYNARAAMANRDIFRDGLLPNTLEFGADFLR